MANFTRVKDMVALQLTMFPETRDDDFLLIGSIYKNYFGIKPEDGFFEVMVNHEDRKLPSFESIRRMRQHLQSTMPLIYGASGQTRKIRKAEEEEYRKEYGHGRG